MKVGISFALAREIFDCLKKRKWDTYDPDVRCENVIYSEQVEEELRRCALPNPKYLEFLVICGVRKHVFIQFAYWFEFSPVGSTDLLNRSHLLA